VTGAICFALQDIILSFLSRPKAWLRSERTRTNIRGSKLPTMQKKTNSNRTKQKTKAREREGKRATVNPLFFHSVINQWFKVTAYLIPLIIDPSMTVQSARSSTVPPGPVAAWSRVSRSCRAADRASGNDVDRDRSRSTTPPDAHANAYESFKRRTSVDQ
jgi:hypothetical protein